MAQQQPRDDLLPIHLLYICVHKIYVRPTSKVVAGRVNRHFKDKGTLTKKLTRADADIVFTYLRDTEHEEWVKAKNMVQADPRTLKEILTHLRVKPRFWLVGSARPISRWAKSTPNTERDNKIDDRAATASRTAMMTITRSPREYNKQVTKDEIQE